MRFLIIITAIVLSNSLTFAQQFSPKVQQAVNSLLEKKHISSGPNCFNAALFIQGIYPFVLLTSDTHANLLFKRSCQIVPVTIDKAPNGSVIQYLVEQTSLHAFTKIDKDQFFQKGSVDQPYEVTSLTTIDQQYGRQNYCKEGKRCLWHYQVLRCQETSYHLPKEFENLLQSYSIALEKRDAFLSQKNSLVSLMEEIVSKKSYLLAFTNPQQLNEFIYFLIDLAQTNRHLYFGVENDEDVISFKKKTDHFLSTLFFELLKNTQINKKNLGDIYDFIYATTASISKPYALIERYFLAAQKNNMKSTDRLAYTIGLLANPNIEYVEAELIISKAIPQLQDSNSHKLLMNSFVTFFRFSKTNYNEKPRHMSLFLDKIANYKISRQMAPDILEFIIESSLLTKVEKKRLLEQFLPKANDEQKKMINDRFQQKSKKF